MQLQRLSPDPILTPNPRARWESAYACNPAAARDGRRVLLLYRAGPNDARHPIYLGLAESRDGVNFRRVSNRPVFGPSADGFDAGCIEDPRLFRLGWTWYMTYAARLAPPGPYWRLWKPLRFVPPHLLEKGAPAASRANLTRSGLAATTDFRSWRRLGPITPAEVDDRDAILFPEPIADSWWMLHRPVDWVGRKFGCKKPSIWIARGPDMLSCREEHLLATPEFWWEKGKIGGSTPPIRTPRGWFVLYHGVDEGRVYRVGAMILDLKDPRRILARTPEPILQPERPWEREGRIPNVVFPCGNLVLHGQLLVYYGGADHVCGVAGAPFRALFDSVLRHRWRG